MKTFFAILFILIGAFYLASCATVKPARNSYLGTEQVYVKSYQKGTEQSVFIGEALIRLKDYYVSKYSSDNIRALNDFSVWKHYGKKGDIYQIHSMMVKDNEEIFLIVFQPYIGVRLGINKKGVFSGDFIGSHNQKQGAWANNPFTPENTQFEIIKNEKIDTTKGYTNFEIVFTGIGNDSIHLLYREFTAEDMARPSFYQELTYPLNTETIRFKKIKMKVNKITNEEISYTVLEDGLSSLTN